MKWQTPAKIMIMQSLSQLVSWCFQPCQPQRTISELKTNFNLYPSYLLTSHKNHQLLFFSLHNSVKTFHAKITKTHLIFYIINQFVSGRSILETLITGYIAERTTDVEIRLKEQSEKAENCRENLWNKIYLKGPQRQKQTDEQNGIKGLGKFGWFRSPDVNCNILTT